MELDSAEQQEPITVYIVQCDYGIPALGPAHVSPSVQPNVTNSVILLVLRGNIYSRI